MITNIVTITVAIFTGLTYIAYKHPKGYRKIYIPLIALIMGIYCIHAIYGFGEMSGFYQAIDEVRNMNKDRLVLTPSHHSDSIWWPIVLIVISFYLAFLRALPSILEIPEDKQ